MDLRPSPIPPHLVFVASGRWFGVPAELASEVVTFPPLTPVPGAPAHLLGLYSHRGQIVPVVDFSLLSSGEPHPTRRAVLVSLGDGVVALTVDGVAGVNEVSGAPQPLSAEGFGAHLRGPAQAAGRDLSLVDLPGLETFLRLRAHVTTPG